jgi:hypothetical protein
LVTKLAANFALPCFSSVSADMQNHSYLTAVKQLTFRYFNLHFSLVFRSGRAFSEASESRKSLQINSLRGFLIFGAVQDNRLNRTHPSSI